MGSELRMFASKASRDPERPKRPLTPWLVYLGEFRAAKSVELKSADVMKRASIEWKGMTDAQKGPYVSRCEGAKAQYEKEFKAYRESGKLDAWKRDPEKPKRPLTPFLRFTQEYRANNSSSGKKITEQT